MSVLWTSLSTSHNILSARPHAHAQKQTAQEKNMNSMVFSEVCLLVIAFSHTLGIFFKKTLLLAFCLHIMFSDFVFLWNVCVCFSCIFLIIFKLQLSYLHVYFLIERQSNSVELDDRGDGKDRGGDVDGETVTRIYFMQTFYFQYKYI